MSTDFHLLFDIDGTLLLTGNAGVRALHRALKAAFQIEDPPEVPFGGRTDQFILREMLEKKGIPPSDENFSKLRTEYQKLLPSTLSDGGGKVLPGVHRLLQTLADDRRVRLGLLTGNLPEAAHTKLQFFQLDSYFQFGVYGDHSHDRCELAWEAALQIRTSFGPVDPRQICIIGDTEQDVFCAKHIGARVIACCTGAGTKQELLNAGADHVVESLQDHTHVARLILEYP